MGIYQGPYCEGCGQINLAGSDRLVVKRVTITGRRGKLKRKEEVMAAFCNEECLIKGLTKRASKRYVGKAVKEWLKSSTEE